MKIHRFITVFSLLLFSEIAFSTQADVDICFTPGARCDIRILDAIEGAHHTIYVQAYQLTSRPILNDLAAAKRRNIKVKVILDKSQARQKGYSTALFLRNMQIPVWIDYKPAIAHNKVMIIDGDLVITGSYNFSRAAQYRNAENLVFIKSKQISQKYLINFTNRLKVSEYVGV